MHLCEKMIESAEYLKSNGFSEDQLTELHHSSLIGGKERFNALDKYYSVNKNLGRKNTDYANRVIFVADSHKRNKEPFSKAILKALEKWPLSRETKPVSNKTTTKKTVLLNNSDLYIVTLNNIKPISVNANDPRKAKKSIKVTKENCKFGKAKDLVKREKNYISTFGIENVNYFPIIKVSEIDLIEKIILKHLDNYRIKGRTGIKNEWLHTITPAEVENIVIEVLNKQNIKYEIISSVK